jgi:hypothetical protein
MKNIFWGSIFMLVFLPQVSFGANQTIIPVNPQLTAFIKQQDSDSVAFFQQQAADRASFMKLHADIIAKMDQQGKALMAYKDAQSHHRLFPGDTSSDLSSPPPPVVDDTYSAFIQKQLNEKQAFLAKQAQDKQTFLNSNP